MGGRGHSLGRGRHWKKLLEMGGHSLGRADLEMGGRGVTRLIGLEEVPRDGWSWSGHWKERDGWLWCHSLDRVDIGRNSMGRVSSFGCADTGRTPSRWVVVVSHAWLGGHWKTLLEMEGSRGVTRLVGVDIGRTPSRWVVVVSLAWSCRHWKELHGSCVITWLCRHWKNPLEMGGSWCH